MFLLEFAPLELQRRIVNGAVERQSFHLIAMLCLIHVGVALGHGGLKLILSVYRGSVSEAANQRLRMRIDPTATAGSAGQRGFRQKGVKVSIVVAEVEAVGGFVDGSFCDPQLNAGILAMGGWLLLQGQTEVGTIVAFISGLARMNGPWGDLVNYFRDLTNAGLKYRMIAVELDRCSPQTA